MKNLYTLTKKKHVVGIESVKFKKDHLCGACKAGKMTRAKHPLKTIMTTSQPFELLHKDLFGPTHYSTLTTTACLYGFVIVDDYSRYTWVHIILYKTEVQDVFRRFANRTMNNYIIKIKHIRSDNGTEFKNTGLDLYLDTMGIIHEFSAPYTPQQNGIVERKNRTLIEMARTMLDEYKTPDRFCAEAINTACYSINRLYLHRILKKTSYELFTGKKPNVSYFRVFGSKCFILVKRGRKSKFAPKTVEGFLLGYDSNTRAYRVFNKSTGLVEVSCDIVFDD